MDQERMSQEHTAAVPVMPHIPDVSDPVDLVVPICTARACDQEYNELRFLLRSFEEHFPQLGQVFIVGVDPPPWLRLDQVVHLPVRDLPAWKDRNIIMKVLAACAQGVSRHFIWSCDDEFLLLPSEPADFWPREEGHVSRWSEAAWQQRLQRKKIWYRRLRHTAEALRAHGKDDLYNFDSHHPSLVDAELFRRVMTEYRYDDPAVAGAEGFTINTLYYNAIDASPLWQPDLHRTPGRLPPAGTRFWNVNKHECWPQALAFLKMRFPRPSRFEVPGQVAATADEALSIVQAFAREHCLRRVCEFGSGSSTGALLSAGCEVITFATDEARIDQVVEDNEDPPALECVLYEDPDIPVELVTGDLCLVNAAGREWERPVTCAISAGIRCIAVRRTGPGAAADIFDGLPQRLGHRYVPMSATPSLQIWMAC